MVVNENYNIDAMDDEEPVVIPLELEDGSTVNSHVIAIFDFEDTDYIALLPEETTEILMFRYGETGEDEISLENIEDPAEWERVVAYFDTLIEEGE